MSTFPHPINLIWQVDPKFLIEADWIRSLFPDFELHSIVDPQLEVVLDHAIVITPGTPVGDRSVLDYLKRFAQQGFKVGVIHISDEWFFAPTDFYHEAAFVLRNFYRPDVAHLDHVLFLPVGYKQGYLNLIDPQPIDQRQYVWSFAGQIGGKLSRRAMMKAAKPIPGGIAFVGQDYSDSSDLSFEGYAKLMSHTQFALAPGGNRCVETSRIYEALEAGAIPIVEIPNRWNLIKSILKELLKPNEFIKHQPWTRRYWLNNLHRLQTPNYWTLAFGNDFPCPSCSNWKQLTRLIPSLKPQQLQQRIQSFWSNYKRHLQQRIQQRIQRTWFQSH